MISCQDANEEPANQDPQKVNSNTPAVGSADYSGNQYIDRILEMNTDERQALLSAAHQNFLELPISSERVHSEILPEMREKREQIFPGFPLRQDSQEASQQVMEDWLQNQPQQLAAYLEFLDDQYQQYERSLP